MAALIIDPRPQAGDPPGTQRAFTNGPIYDRECIWAADEIDSSWHTLPWDAGTCGADVGLNDLNPDYFIITGVDGAQSALTAPGIAVTMNRGERLLARYICAGYLPQRVRFGGLTGQIIANDGRPLPSAVSATQVVGTSGQRYDVLFTPTSTGTYPMTFDFLDWITGNRIGRATTRITVVQGPRLRKLYSRSSSGSRIAVHATLVGRFGRRCAPAKRGYARFVMANRIGSLRPSVRRKKTGQGWGDSRWHGACFGAGVPHSFRNTMRRRMTTGPRGPAAGALPAKIRKQTFLCPTVPSRFPSPGRFLRRPTERQSRVPDHNPFNVLYEVSNWLAGPSLDYVVALAARRIYRF